MYKMLDLIMQYHYTLVSWYILPVLFFGLGVYSILKKKTKKQLIFSAVCWLFSFIVLWVASTKLYHHNKIFSEKLSKEKQTLYEQLKYVSETLLSCRKSQEKCCINECKLEYTQDQYNSYHGIRATEDYREKHLGIDKEK